jgi:hypothetical protein
MGTNGTNTVSWKAAPRVAFPSYSFTVQNGAGLSLAVPVQGVPVGLSLLASYENRADKVMLKFDGGDD